MRLLALLAILLLGCSPTHVAGIHPPPGSGVDELRHDDVAYYCDRSERCSYGTVDKLTDTQVHFYFRHAPRSPGFAYPRARVVPRDLLSPGVVVENFDGDWFVIEAVTNAGVKLRGRSEPLAFDKLRVPTQNADALDRHDRRMLVGIGVVMCLLALAMLVLARKLSVRVGRLRAEASPSPTKQSQGKTAGEAGRLEVLSCKGCGAPVQLVARAESECAACHQPITIPPAYVALVESHAAIVDRLPREAAALRRARILGNPLVALAIIASSYLAFKLFALIMAKIVGRAQGLSTGSLASFLVAYPLLYLPFALVISGIGQLVSGLKLAAKVPALAAARTERGFACRGCGGPLGATANGVAELCHYCGAQNLIAPALATSAATATHTARALETSIKSASATFWARFFAIWVPILYVVGAVAIVVYPFLILVGAST